MGPLKGMKIIEFPAIGPVPMCGMLLADLGAQVLRLTRKEESGLGINMDEKHRVMHRNRKALAVDLKDSDDVALVLELTDKADVLLEGFRPGVMERLGLGPDALAKRNPLLIYGRMTGWGQSGPLAQTAGHDINYIALVGALSAIGRDGGPPTPPLNLVGDFAGGSLFLAIGVLSAIWERQTSGKGQVVDAAIVDGTAAILAGHFSMLSSGVVTTERGKNLLDSGAPYYETYACSDGNWIAVGAIEEKFYAQLVAKMGLSKANLPSRDDKGNWPKLKALFANTFRQKTSEEWRAVFEGTDCCVTVVNDTLVAQHDPHLDARKTFLRIEGVTQPAPAPRFSRSEPDVPRAPKGPVSRSEALADW